MKKLTRKILRDAVNASLDKEIWQPDWKCHCCQDTGLITPMNVKKIIEDFDIFTDERPVCNGCEAFSKKFKDSIDRQFVFDTRFDLDLCKEIHQESKNEWSDYLKSRVEYLKGINNNDI